jgi:hypothetical protein
MEQIDRLRLEEGLSPTPLDGILRSLRENKELLAPEKIETGPGGVSYLIPWIDK